MFNVLQLEKAHIGLIHVSFMCYDLLLRDKYKTLSSMENWMWGVATIFDAIQSVGWNGLSIVINLRCSIFHHNIIALSNLSVKMNVGLYQHDFTFLYLITTSLFWQFTEPVQYENLNSEEIVALRLRFNVLLYTSTPFGIYNPEEVLIKKWWWSCFGM